MPYRNKLACLLMLVTSTLVLYLLALEWSSLKRLHSGKLQPYLQKLVCDESECQLQMH
jgi:hypothetical protein